MNPQGNTHRKLMGGSTERGLCLGQRKGGMRDLVDYLTLRHQGIVAYMSPQTPLGRIWLKVFWSCQRAPTPGAGEEGAVSENACLPHKARISLSLAQRSRFEAPPGSVQGLFHFFPPLLSFLVNLNPFRGFKPHLHADGPHICISDSESTPTPSGRPHFTNCLLPRISEGYYNLTFPKLNSPQTCLPANSSCFNSSLTVPPKPEIWGSSYTSSDNTLNHLKFFPRSEFLQLWVRCAWLYDWLAQLPPHCNCGPVFPSGRERMSSQMWYSLLLQAKLVKTKSAKLCWLRQKHQTQHETWLFREGPIHLSWVSHLTLNLPRFFFFSQLWLFFC